MNKYPLLVIMVIAVLADTACAIEPANQDSGNVSTSPNTEVIQSTALPPTPLPSIISDSTPVPAASDTPAPLPSNTPDSASVPMVAPTSESAAAPTGASKATVVEITAENYEEEVLQSPVPVLIHFWAAWSGPSRVLAPTIEAIAKEYAGRVKVGAINVDDHPDLADQWGVSGLPTLIVINQGNEQERIVGTTSKEAIGQMLDKQLGSNP
jgi:thioredoxin 1